MALLGILVAAIGSVLGITFVMNMAAKRLASANAEPSTNSEPEQASTLRSTFDPVQDSEGHTWSWELHSSPETGVFVREYKDEKVTRDKDCKNAGLAHTWVKQQQQRLTKQNA